MDGGLGRRERERGIDRPLFSSQPSSRQEPRAHPPILLGRFQPPRPRRRRQEAPRGARRARRALDGGGARRGARTTSPSPPSLLPLSCPAPCAARHPLSRHKEGAAAERGALAEQEQGVARGGVVPAQGLDEVRVAGLGPQAAVQLGDQGGLRDVGGFHFFVFFRGWGTGETNEATSPSFPVSINHPKIRLSFLSTTACNAPQRDRHTTHTARRRTHADAVPHLTTRNQPTSDSRPPPLLIFILITCA